jgi:hypothetical protein
MDWKLDMCVQAVSRAILSPISEHLQCLYVSILGIKLKQNKFPMHKPHKPHSHAHSRIAELNLNNKVIDYDGWDCCDTGGGVWDGCDTGGGIWDGCDIGGGVWDTGRRWGLGWL